MVTIEEIKLLIEKFEKIKKSDFEHLLNSHIDDLKSIKELIERKDRETGNMITKGPAWFRTDLLEKKHNEPDKLLYHAIRDKLNHFAKTNLYNSLEIGPGHGEFSTLFYAWKKQFFLDLLPEYQKKLRRVFNPQHEKKIRQVLHHGRTPLWRCAGEQREFYFQLGHFRVLHRKTDRSISL